MLKRDEYENISRANGTIGVSFYQYMPSQLGRLSLDPDDYAPVAVVKGLYLWAGNIPEPYTRVFIYAPQRDVANFAVFKRIERPDEDSSLPPRSS